MPFKMISSQWAQARSQTLDPRKPQRLISGRRGHVWLHGVLVPIACGIAPGGVEIRKAQDAPWHRITYTPDEAFALLEEHYPMQKGLLRKVALHRERNGLT